MVNCEITKGRALPCKNGAAGLLSVYFLNRPFEVTYDGSLITDITNEDGTPITLYEYELDNTGNMYDENLQADRNNGTYYAEQVLTLALQVLQDQDLAEVENLAKGRPAVLVRYRNGKVRLAGIERGMDTTGSQKSGGDLGDFQGYELTLTAKEDGYAPLLVGYTKNDPFGGLVTTPVIVTAEPAIVE